MKKIIFVLIFGFFYFIDCQNIVTAWNYDKVQMYDINRITTAITNNLVNSIKSIPDFKEESVQISNLKLTNVQLTLYDSFLDYKRKVFLLSPHKSILSFNFTYKKDSDESHNAKLELNAHTLKLSFNNDKIELKSYVISTFLFYINDFNIYGLTNKEDLDIIKKTMFNGFINNKIINGIITDKINTIILDYYTELYSKKKDYDINLSNLFEEKLLTFKLDRFMGFCEDPKGLFKTAACFYSCERSKESVDKSKVPFSNEKFLNMSDSYNLFINAELINDIFRDMAVETLTPKYITEDTYSEKKKEQLGYNFTLASLKKFFKGLDTYDDNLYYKLKITYEKVEFIRTAFCITFELSENQTEIFSVHSVVDYEPEIKIKGTSTFNICVSKPKCSLVWMSGAITFNDKIGLMKAIDNSFDLDAYPLCLTKNGISMKDYYSLIKNGYSLTNGVYLEGEQLYQ